MILRYFIVFHIVVTLVVLTVTHTLITLLTVLVKGTLIHRLTLITHLLVIIRVQLQTVYDDFLLNVGYWLDLVKHMLMCGLLVVVERWRVLIMVKSWNNFDMLLITYTPQITLILNVITVWDRRFKYHQWFNFRFLIYRLVSLDLSFVVIMVFRVLVNRFTIVLTAFFRLGHFLHRFLFLIWLYDVSQDNLLNWNKRPKMLIGHFFFNIIVLLFIN